MTRWRQPILRGGSKPVIAAACTWELVALFSPDLPTITELVQRSPRRILGVGLLALLAHHFFLEQECP